jgi:very-short-patch-repair endonuclease
MTIPFVGSTAITKGLLTRRQLQSDTWRRLLPDIYAWAELTIDHHLRCHAAGLYLRGRGAVSGRSAAAFWGADTLIRGEPIEVTVPAEVRIRPPAGLRVVRSPLATCDLTCVGGTPVTTPTRTAFDVARRLPIAEAVVTVDAMLAKRLIAEDTLLRLRLDWPGWPGVAQLQRVHALSDAGAESPQESRLRMILIHGSLPRPVTQYVVRDALGAFVARLDLAYPDHRLGIEYEGDHHRDRGTFQRDLRRINALRACGWTVLRFAAADIYRNPGRIVELVRAALEVDLPTGH